MSSLFMTPKMAPMQTPPPLPSKSDDAIRQEADARLRSQFSQGQAANYLANTTSSFSTTSDQQYLGSM